MACRPRRRYSLRLQARRGVRGLYLRVSRTSHVARVPLVRTDEDYVGAGIHGWSSVIGNTFFIFPLSRYNEDILRLEFIKTDFAYRSLSGNAVLCAIYL